MHRTSTQTMHANACRGLRGRWDRLLLARFAAVAALAAVSAAGAAGALPASALATGASAVGWGENYRTQLDAGYKSVYEESPVPLVGVSEVKALAVGNGFSLALLGDGTVRAWGGNTWGQLGDGTRTSTWAKDADEVAVEGLSGVKAIAASNGHALALLEDGTVEAWGNDNYGQLGEGVYGTEGRSGENQTVPHPVPGLTDVIAIAAGGGSNYALLADHTLMAWGQNNAGQLGIGETGPETCVFEGTRRVPCSTVPRPVGTPVGGGGATLAVEPLREVIAISAGDESAYAVLADHRLDAWGSNGLGQLGTGGELNAKATTPRTVLSARTGSPLAGVSSVAAGGDHALALLESGQLLAWGSNVGGESGEAASQACGSRKQCVPEPTALPDLAGVSYIAAGSNFSLAASGGEVYAFGKNARGQLGDGSTTGSAAPVPVDGLSDVSGLAAGSTHAFALLAPGAPTPPAAVSVQPGAGSLSVTWSARSPQVRLRDRLAKSSLPKGTGDRFLQHTALGEGEQGFTFTGLQAVPYEIVISAEARDGTTKSRIAIASPLP